jgi:hypothetical protein
MYSISDLLEIGPAKELVMAVKVEDIVDDVAVPSTFPSEQFDE